MNAPDRALWTFRSSVPPDRAAKLLSWQSFDEIVEQFSTCQIAAMWWEPAMAPRLKEVESHRASFVLTVLPELYDAFFNAPVGYRGQFSRSERHGECANRQLLEALFPRFLEVASHGPTPIHLVTASLKGSQAKIWIDESEVEDQETPSIDFLLWESHEPNGIGLRAPRGTRLEVKGGWVSSAGEEVINTSKLHRSGNITRTGDSR